MAKYIARSTSDPRGKKGGLDFPTEAQAEYHKDRMNILRENYDENPAGLWNKDFWKTKPEPWIVELAEE